MPETFVVTLEEQLACVRREISMRERCYPRWVIDKRLTQAKAEAELAGMRAVLRTLEGLQAAALAA